ncbi:DUF5590 domain-containing protein [Metabacillus idriensis]|uniref:cell wall elongation regulator TseB-like domain-containing protein n=1 Tax=Metabacillus idriensis TaxID=324768 RepID=UPI00174DDD0A|nr:DUF5590 domain-containing protein [Metabacillus idriensis]
MGRKLIIASIVLAIVLLIALSGFIHVYQSAMTQKNSGHYQAIDRAAGQTELKNAESVHTFNGLEQYFVIAGKNESNKNVYVWVAEDSKKKPVLKLASDGISEKEALEIVNREQNPQKIISVKLGMEKNVPLWEIKYIDEQNRYTYDFVNFTNGEIQKHIAIKK